MNEQHDRDLDDDDDGVEAGRLLDADDQDRRHQGDDQQAGQVERRPVGANDRRRAPSS